MANLWGVGDAAVCAQPHVHDSTHGLRVLVLVAFVQLGNQVAGSLDHIVEREPAAGQPLASQRYCRIAECPVAAGHAGPPLRTQGVCPWGAHSSGSAIIS